MLLIYSPQITPRIKYITETLLHRISGVSLRFTESKEEFTAFNGAKLNYSTEIITNTEFRIHPVGLLFQKTVTDYEISVEYYSRYPVLFPVQQGHFRFDIFAAAFFLITRYEEYRPHQKDDYGRFDYRESVAFKNDFLQKPLVNIWLQDLQNALKQKFPALLFSSRPFRFIPTYDIDIAYSYLLKGPKRNALGMVRSILNGDLHAVKSRTEVLFGKKQDPFDVYEWLYALHLKFGLRPYYFFLLAKNVGMFDKNIDPYEPRMRELIQYHSAGYEVGIHPSWQSGDRANLLAEEVELLEDIIQKKVVNSRQHYIRFTLPGTYRKLADNGVRHEFSMGYGSINGFRASIASSFYWYDLERDKKTNLLVHPFCFMDANSFFEQGQTPAQTYAEIKRYHDIIKRVNGTMITIWHNNFLGSDPLFKGWREVYELFLEQVLYWDV